MLLVCLFILYCKVDDCIGIVPALTISNLESIGLDSVDEEELVFTEDSVTPVNQITVNFNNSKGKFNGISGNRYMIYSVNNFSYMLNIDSDNLLYVNQATAENGIAEMDFYNNDGAVTVIVGDFGNGIETREAEIKNQESDETKFTVAIADTEVKYKDTAKIKPTITADSGAKYTVEYKSSDPSVATVDKDGNITTHHKGTTTITCIVTDEAGNTAKDTCTVTVKFQWWQWLIWIFLLGFLWY